MTVDAMGELVAVDIDVIGTGNVKVISESSFSGSVTRPKDWS